MYFTTFNHYDDNDIMYDNHYNIIYNNEQCLICWDKYTTNNNVYKMQSLLSSSIYYISPSLTETLPVYVGVRHEVPPCTSLFKVIGG